VRREVLDYLRARCGGQHARRVRELPQGGPRALRADHPRGERAARLMGTSLPASGSALAAARALRPLIETNAAASEAAGHLTEAVVSGLHEARIFGIFVPRGLGGLELAPTQGLEVLEEIAYADGSTGWVTMAACVSISTGAAFLGD